MKNILLKLEYDGYNYCGWQKQINEKTIQGTLEEILKKITKEDIEVIGCSRTDSGVHAIEYVCNFKTHSNIPGDKFKYILNQNLPNDISVIDSEYVDEEFHSRYDCKGKTYIYKICNREFRSAIGRNYVFDYKYKLDIDKMKEAAKYFIGKHDFAAFKNVGSSVKTTIRTITELSIEKDDDIIIFRVTGDGFLYNMVRIVVGTLIDVGIGKRSPEEIKNIIISKNRKNAGASVPAAGLCLYKVFY